MGIEPASVNVSDLEITRPNRRGPGGDIQGTPTVLGTGLDACLVAEDRILRSPRGREILILGRFFIDPIFDARGDPVPVLPGDLAEWTDLLGVGSEPQEIVSVEPTGDCDGKLDVLTFRVGRTASVGG